MGDTHLNTGFRLTSDPYEDDRRQSRYNTPGYYAPNRQLGEYRDRRHDELNDQQNYDQYNSGKQEDYKADGYYGSTYGSINESNRGRDFERDAGYRDSYNRLTQDQWPEIQEAAARRGFNLRRYELEQRGVHRGKGPRSYQRSDFRIHEDIYDVLYEDPYIDASDIDIKVEKGEVILTGTVENRHIKRRVEDIIEDRVSGIRHLENRIHPSQTTTVNVQNSEH